MSREYIPIILSHKSPFTGYENILCLEQCSYNVHKSQSIEIVKILFYNNIHWINCIFLLMVFSACLDAWFFIFALHLWIIRREKYYTLHLSVYSLHQIYKCATCRQYWFLYQKINEVRFFNLGNLFEAFQRHIKFYEFLCWKVLFGPNGDEIADTFKRWSGY